jgi:hypothetical protein
MDESLILSKFDSIVESGLVLYDKKQDIVEYTDGDLKVSVEYTPALYIHITSQLILTIINPVSICNHLCSHKKTYHTIISTQCKGKEWIKPTDARRK